LSKLAAPLKATIAFDDPEATLMPAKTRVFIDFVVEAFRRRRLAERFAGSIG